MTEIIETPKRSRRSPEQDDTKDAVALPTKRVRITAYKIFTRHGRFIEGQYVDLPEDEADALIAESKAI